MSRKLTKPYHLEWKILNLLMIFKSADIIGISNAVREVYSEHTVRKILKKMESRTDENKEPYIESVRDNKRKIYKLTKEGFKYLEYLKTNTKGLPEVIYNKIILDWSNSIEGNKFSTKLNGSKIDAIKVNDKETYALVIKSIYESAEDFKQILKQIAEGKEYQNLKHKKINYVIYNNTYGEIDVSDIKSSTKIELFEIDAD